MGCLWGREKEGGRDDSGRAARSKGGLKATEDSSFSSSRIKAREALETQKFSADD